MLHPFFTLNPLKKAADAADNFFKGMIILLFLFKS